MFQMIVCMLVIRDVKMLVNAVVNVLYGSQSRLALSDAVVVDNAWCTACRAVSDH
jgi:hypothetical protein